MEVGVKLTQLKGQIVFEEFALYITLIHTTMVDVKAPHRC